MPATVIGAYDGKSFAVNAHISPGHTIVISVWVRGIDAPKIRGKCEIEIIAAIEARDFAADLLGTLVLLLDVERGKLAGRVIADVSVGNGQDLATKMIAAGFARPYDGRNKRLGWCPNV